MKGRSMKTIKEKTDQEAEKPAAKRRMRWWIPTTIVALAVAIVGRIRGSAELDSNFKNMQAMLTIAVSILLLLVWFVFLTRLRWRTRMAGLGIFILCLVGVKQSVRFDGSVDGSGTPRIVWKWTPRKSGDVVAFKTVNTPKEQPKLEAAFDYPG